MTGIVVVAVVLCLVGFLFAYAIVRSGDDDR